ncbi:hypothetical protein RHSIM_Rhsim07G0156600 [Rhododendron simsii]|uniref:Uncharacterized protein n=1 Tax=Rhododendron simsii TaxID=118357 RepID=A0A834LJ79_RHOSS|nr:hypothetical protein RHSIM_Rhsim07G0156600 [Rhododendron simsii]
MDRSSLRWGNVGKRSSRLGLALVQGPTKGELVQDPMIGGCNNRTDTSARNGTGSSRPPPDSHSFKEKISDSKDELLEVLEGVESIDQEVGALNHHIRTTTSFGTVQSKLKSPPALEPPDLLGPEVKKKAAEQVSKGSTVLNKYLSKSAKKRLKKQAKEESISSFSSGGN